MNLQNKENTIFSKDIELKTDSNYFNIFNPDYFLTFNDLEIGDGIDIIENILIVNDESIDTGSVDNLIDSVESFKEKNNLVGSYISQNFNDFDYIINNYEDMSIITLFSNDIEIQDFFNSLKVANSKKGFEMAQIDFGQIILINKALSPKLLIKLYKIATKIRTKFFESLNLPLHINNILNKDDFLVIGSNLPDDSLDEEYMDYGLDITNITYDDEKLDFDEFKINLEDRIIISLEDSLEKLNLSFGVLDYLVAEGILIGDLVEAGMELLVGVEESDEIKEKLEKQILKSLEDINVITLIMAAIRTEQDYQNNRIREVDVSDDPAYLYTDEVFGLAISNQIAGTKATFNFKRYDEAKPGILFGLGPMLDDIFAGLIAGSMSKIFEE